MSEQDTFGPRLRSERERRGISLNTIATVTKVGADLWVGLERNDFSKWPSGIFARAFVRDYARAIGMDADEVVDEFCRLFRGRALPNPQGSRGSPAYVCRQWNRGIDENAARRHCRLEAFNQRRLARKRNR